MIERGRDAGVRFVDHRHQLGGRQAAAELDVREPEFFRPALERCLRDPFAHQHETQVGSLA